MRYLRAWPVHLLLILVVAFGLALLAQQVQARTGVWEGGTYYDPGAGTVNPLYVVQNHSMTDPFAGGERCMLIVADPTAQTQGWPAASVFTISYGCSPTYTTTAPLAELADYLFYLVVLLGLYGVLRWLVERTKKNTTLSSSV